MKVLMVEDEELTRDGILSCVDWETLGITKVVTASDGEEGLSVCKELNPDIILADVRMPRMDGITMAFEIRNYLPSCEIIFISAYSDKEYLKSAIELSAINYIEKPVEPSELLDALKRSILKIEREKRQKTIEEEYNSQRNKVFDDTCYDDCIPAAWQSSMHMADKIERYIQENLSDINLSLTQISTHFDLTKQYICLIFKKEKNETINQCIIKTRLRWAKDYLRRNPHAKIKNAAMRSGFIDSSYFIKIYKKYEGITPADYKRQQHELFRGNKKDGKEQQLDTN